jgi:hypothetical protein
MPLKSRLFKGDPKLEACLVSHAAHVVPGAQGEHVGKIQQALVALGAGIISVDEIVSMKYGSTTVRTVLAFKGPPRNIINKAYQNSPDNIVGIMTIAALDQEFFDFENQPPLPLASIFVSLTVDGSPHDHNKCPIAVRRRGLNGVENFKAHHLGTPINPQGFGRKINLGGEGETDYLGFDDFMPNRFSIEPKDRPLRPLTSTLSDRVASDICLRFSPILKDGSEEKGKREIIRIAAPLCRLTFCGDDVFERTLLTMGALIERLVFPNPVNGGVTTAFVILMS